MISKYLYLIILNHKTKIVINFLTKHRTMIDPTVNSNIYLYMYDSHFIIFMRDRYSSYMGLNIILVYLYGDIKTP